MAPAISFGDINSGFQAGIINGPVNTEFHHHAPPARLETPPNPSILIPFSRDTDFVQRGDILDQIHQKCAVLRSRTALVGLGGVGKSQLAIEYAYRARDRSQKTWVFWVHASNEARFEQSFRDIANYVKIPGRQNPKANIFQLVQDWLRNERKGEWILILDNVDDASFLIEARSTDQEGQTNRIVNESLQPLVSYLPQSPNGSILITTRSKYAARKLVEPGNIVEIEPMSRADALMLFEKKWRGYNDGDDAAELATALEFMPLAIVQAAAYISQRAPRYSVREYLQDFRKSDRERTSLLNYEGKQLRRDSEAKNSIIITWQISFGHIRETRQSAADLLSLMSFFDWQGIPEDLLRSRSKQKNSQQGQIESKQLRQGDTPRTSLLYNQRTGHRGRLQARLSSLKSKLLRPKFKDDNSANNNADYCAEDEDNTPQSRVNDRFEEDVTVLRNYSFISVNADGTTFEMHRLVQLATRKWLEAHGQIEKWKQQSIKNLDAEFPTGVYENWVKCQTLFPHVQSAAAQKPKEQDSLTDWASLLYKAARYAWRIGNWLEAEKMSLQAFKVRNRILGQAHNDTVSSMAMVGLTYKSRGKYDEAEPIHRQTLQLREEALGKEHPSTLTSMNNLASLLESQGKYDEAEPIYRQTLQLREKALGKEHPSTLTSMNNLALLLQGQGKYDEAEPIHRQTLQLREKALGKEHPSTLTSMNNLASLLENQGKYDEAEPIYRQTLQLSEKALGKEHPSTLTSMNNLALLLQGQGKYDEAEPIHRQTLQLREKVLGKEHPSTLTSMNNLASLLKSQGKYDEK